VEYRRDDLGNVLARDGTSLEVLADANPADTRLVGKARGPHNRVVEAACGELLVGPTLGAQVNAKGVVSLG
jgi:hypothetical protein